MKNNESRKRKIRKEIKFDNPKAQHFPISKHHSCPHMSTSTLLTSKNTLKKATFPL